MRFSHQIVISSSSFSCPKICKKFVKDAKKFLKYQHTFELALFCQFLGHFAEYIYTYYYGFAYTRYTIESV